MPIRVTNGWVDVGDCVRLLDKPCRPIAKIVEGSSEMFDLVPVSEWPPSFGQTGGRGWFLHGVREGERHATIIHREARLERIEKYILVVSREHMPEILRIPPPSDEDHNGWALISVYTPEELPGTHPNKECTPYVDSHTEAKLREAGCTKMLSLGFHDVTLKRIEEMRGEPEFREYVDKYLLFSREQAREVIEFIDNMTSSVLVVHCDAGISRSGTIGWFACKRLGYDAVDFERMNPQIMLNDYMLAMLNEEAAAEEIPNWSPVKEG